MENLIVATFGDAQNAHAAVARLKELDMLDDVIVYNMVLVRKQGDNQFEYLYREGPDTDNLPAKGAIIGSVIGLVAGPVGMAIGMMTGVLAGAIDEDDVDDFADELKEKVNNKMKDGEFAVILDVEEDIELLVDSYLGASATAIVRTSLADDYGWHDARERDELDKEIEDAEKELDTAADAQKAAIKAKLDKLKARRADRHKKLKGRMDSIKKRLQERMKSLDQKIAAANGKRKEKLKAYKEKIHTKLDKWNKEVANALA